MFKISWKVFAAVFNPKKSLRNSYSPRCVQNAVLCWSDCRRNLPITTDHITFREYFSLAYNIQNAWDGWDRVTISLCHIVVATIVYHKSWRLQLTFFGRFANQDAWRTPFWLTWLYYLGFKHPFDFCFDCSTFSWVFLVWVTINGRGIPCVNSVLKSLNSFEWTPREEKCSRILTDAFFESLHNLCNNSRILRVI